MVGSIIKSIVSQGKRVIIPDFGAFLIKDSTLNPVITKDNITFSPFLRYNDGFLETELAHIEGIHKDEAAFKVAEFVNKIRVTIFDNEALFQIEGLGYFFKDDKGNASFSIGKPVVVGDAATIAATPANTEPVEAPQPEVIQKRSSLPDSDVDAAQKKVEVSSPIGVVRAPVAEEVHPSPSASVTSTSAEKMHAEVVNDRKVVDKHSNTPPSKKFSKGLLYSFLILIVGLLILNVFWNDIVGDGGAATKPKIILDPLEPEQIEAEKAKVKTDEQVQEAIGNEVVATVEKRVNASNATDSKGVADKSETAKANEKKVEQTATKEKGKESAVKKDASKGETVKAYVLVLGSFGTAENAEKHLKALAKKNIKGKVVTRNNRSSVISKDFKTYEDAQAEQTRVRSLGFDGWITQR